MAKILQTLYMDFCPDNDNAAKWRPVNKPLGSVPEYRLVKWVP